MGKSVILDSIVDHKEFVTEEQCLVHLEKIRWPNGIVCPTCHGTRISRIQTRNRAGKIRRIFQCLDKNCRYQFSATTGTIFHDSHLPLNKWFTAVALVSASNGNIPTNQLRNTLGVQYKTAQRVVQLIREALCAGTIEQQRLKAQPETAAAHAPTHSTRPSPKPPAAIPERRIPAPPAAENNSVPHHIAAAGEAAIGDALTLAASLAKMTVRFPFIFAKYLIEKI